MTSKVSSSGPMIEYRQVQVILPYHLRNLARITTDIELSVRSPVTADSILDALEMRYPMLAGTIRDHTTQKRRPLLRYFACEKDFSHTPTDLPLPAPVADGTEPFIVVGAVSGG